MSIRRGLRRAVEDVQPVNADRAARQRRYLDNLTDYLDLEVLQSSRCGGRGETALHHGLGIVHVDRDFGRISEVRPLTARRLG